MHNVGVVILRDAFDQFKRQPITNPMGKGDKRTKKGKIFRGSYGKRRPRKLKSKGKTPQKRG